MLYERLPAYGTETLVESDNTGAEVVSGEGMAASVRTRTCLCAEDAEDPVEVMSEGDLEDAGELPDDVLNRLRPREWQHAEIKGV